MKLSRVFLSLLGLLFLLVMTVPSWAGPLPRKKPSDYGVSDQQVQLANPSFATISQNGVTISLDSVFCSVNDCAGGGGNPTDQSITYFFAINLAAGAQIDSLTFGTGFATFDGAFSGIDPDLTFSCAPGHTCAPGSDSALPDAVTETMDCSSGSCIVSFTNFNAATVGTGKIILAAQTTDTSVLNVGGVAQTPTLKLNGGTTVSVPEPASLWFLGIAGLACMAGIATRQRKVSFKTGLVSGS
jgi:hypothetical protein